MFEAGIELKRRFGAENVFDFSLGNPDLPSPKGVGDVLREIAAQADQPLAFGYCPNAGLPTVRARLAAVLSREQETMIGPEHIVMTVGAAGGLNAFFRAVLEPGDEVVCPAPYFVEYGAYVGHFGGKLVPVAMAAPTFSLQVDTLAAAITPRTRAVLVNTPNNPTGAVYEPADMGALGEMLKRVNAGRERPVFLLSDEPYRLLCYDGAVVAPILPLSPYAVVVGSYSKSLSLAGERIGYLLVNPSMPGADTMAAALTLTTRTLGFVNAPVIGQQLVGALCGEGVDVAVYERRRAAMATVLRDAGLRFALPRGAFYFFVEAPGGDDQAFVQHLVSENILAVPGRGFGFPGYFRMTFCMDERVIARSGPAFLRAMETWRHGPHCV
jgi:aspartate aminotransferase